VCIKASGLKFVGPELFREEIKNLQLLVTLRTFDWIGFSEQLRGFSLTSMEFNSEIASKRH
jgi:hypothetical protein